MTEATVVIPPEYSSPHPPMALVAQWEKNELTGEEKTRPTVRAMEAARAAVSKITRHRMTGRSMAARARPMFDNEWLPEPFR